MIRLPWGAPRGPSRWTLRSRLLALTLALLALVALVIGTVSTLSLRQTLVAQVDGQLAGAARLTGGGGDGDGLGGRAFGGRTVATDPDDQAAAFLRAPGQRPGTVSALLSGATVLGSARLSGAGRGAAAPSLTTAQERALAPAHAVVSVPGGSLRAATRALPGLGNYRIAAVALADGSTLLVGLPLRDTEAAVHRLALTEALVALVGLALVAVAGDLLLRSALRPLTRVAATASRVSELRLDRGEVRLADRVPDADTDPRTEVGQVGAALNRMLGHVGTALAVRQESETRVRTFLADASHELRTPLTAIRGYAELTRRSRGQVSADVAYALRRVESEAQRMTDLVEDMLLLARLDSGRPLARDPVDLSGLLVDVASDAHAAGPDHPLTLRLPPEPVVVPGDAARLHQVLANLLANARAHTPPGTPVTVSLERSLAGSLAGPLEHSSTEAVLAVVDAGPGVPPDLLPHVFARFARGDTSRARAAGSTGLGLSIVDAVVSAHGGRVTVASVPGRTAFTVRLPADDAPTGRGPRQRPHRPARPGARIG